MKVDLTEDVCLVTGGANGIGRATVQALAENGAKVGIVDLDGEAGEAAAKEVRASGADCHAIQGDVSDPKQVEHVVSKFVDRWECVTVLVNNAGINTGSDRAPLYEFTLENWNRILEVDLTGVFVCSRAVVPIMLKAGGGRIVNISSIAGLVPLRLQSAYVAAKAGVANLTRSMAIELGSKGILVNAVAPGSTLTRGTEKLFYGKDGFQSKKAANMLSHIPLGRPGKTEEIANAVLFLVSPDASYVNGVVLPVDGGWIAGYHRDF